MANEFIVYGLCDPRTGELRYVGKSTCGLSRPKAHLRPSVLRRTRSHCGNWIKQLTADGMKPEIVILETTITKDALVEAEQFYIAYFRFIGCNLTNLTCGGDGKVGWRMPQSTRDKIAKAHLGGHKPKLSDAHRAAISRANTGKIISEETRARLSAALKGKPKSPEHIAKMIKNRWGK